MMKNLSSISESALKDIFHILLEKSFEAVLITDGGPRDHKIIYANQRFCNMTGYHKEELYGKNPRILSGARTNPHVIKRLKKALNDCTSFLGATTNYRKDGSSYPVQWNIYPIFADHNDSHPSYFVSIQKDLSEIRESLNRLKSSSQAFRTFLSELGRTENKTDPQLVSTLETSAKRELQANAEALAPFVNTDSAVDDDDLLDVDFFDFDDSALTTESDEPISVLSAKTLFETTDIDYSAVADICSVSSNLANMFEIYDLEEMKALDRREFIDELQEISNSIFYIEEFIDISTAVSELAVCMLHNVDKPLDLMMSESLKGLVNDLVTWVNAVFVEKNADDVHWLDNSIIGSCKQILVFIRLKAGS